MRIRLTLRSLLEAIFKAIEQVTSEGKSVTFDIGGNDSTSRLTSAIYEVASKLLRR